MLNIIWPAFIIISVIYALISGNIENVSNGIFDSANSAVQLTLTFLGTICLWNGIMEIAKKTSLTNALSKALSQKTPTYAALDVYDSEPIYDKNNEFLIILIFFLYSILDTSWISLLYLLEVIHLRRMLKIWLTMKPLV